MSLTHPNSTHGNTEQGPDSQKLLICVAEGRPQFENGDEQQIEHQCPLSPITIRCDTEQHGTDRAEEECEGDGGGDIGGVPTELRRKSSRSQTDGEVLKDAKC